MAKFNLFKKKAEPTETNFMGEKAYALSSREELVSSVLTTFLQDGYYEKENETVERILGLVEKCDPIFVAKLALYARNQGNLRSVTHLLAASLAIRLSGMKESSEFYRKIAVRPDDMSEIVAAYAFLYDMKLTEIKAIPNGIKRGFRARLESLDPYLIDKYKMRRREISLIDLVRLFHPKANEKNAEAYRRLVHGESLEGLYDAKKLEVEMTRAGQNKKDATIAEKAEAKHEAISSILANPKGMPIMNLLRNLRTILLYAPDKVDEACAQLTIPEKILGSRLLPFRFASAYEEIEKVENPREAIDSSGIVFESEMTPIAKISSHKFKVLKEKLLDSIETALQISCRNIPRLSGNVAILNDHSGSCRGDDGGNSRVSAFSKTSTAMIGNLFASMIAWNQDDVYLGLFGDRLINVPIDRKMRMLDFNRKSFDIGTKCGGATETGIYTFFRNAVKSGKKIDNVVIFSDCQIGRGDRFTPWYGSESKDCSEHFHELFKKFRKINPLANIIVVNLRQYGGTSVFDPKQRILNIAGWSTSIFNTISSQCKGWDAIIKEIEAVEI